MMNRDSYLSPGRLYSLHLTLYVGFKSDPLKSFQLQSLS